MPNYVNKSRQRLGHKNPIKPQHNPHPYTAPQYGKKQQMVNNPSNLPFSPAHRKTVQEFLGLFQYYARSIDTTMLSAINSIATNMTTATKKDLDFRINQFLDYAATHPDAKIRYVASEMQLWIHSDASYLTEPKARSRAGGHFFLSKKPTYPIDSSSLTPPHNGAILMICKIIDSIMASAMEAEVGAAFINTRESVPVSTTLDELGYKQSPIPLQMDNKSAVGILIDTMAQGRSKPMDMHFHWLKEKDTQKYVKVFWKEGPTNLAEYPTKHHPTKHHIAVRPSYVLNATSRTPTSNAIQQGCTKIQRPESLRDSSSNPLNDVTRRRATTVTNYQSKYQRHLNIVSQRLAHLNTNNNILPS